MNAGHERIQLSRDQLEYLQCSSFLPAPLVKIVHTWQLKSSDLFFLHISREVAQEFRSIFTERLARVGFDATYALTSEGRMLEELIDCFYTSVA